MSDEINVISRTQTIIVEPTSGSVAVINAGPEGPPGPSYSTPVYSNGFTAHTNILSQGEAVIETQGEFFSQFTNLGFEYFGSPVYRVDISAGQITVSSITDPEEANVNINLWELVTMSGDCPISSPNFLGYAIPTFFSTPYVDGTDPSFVVFAGGTMFNPDGTPRQTPLALLDKIPIQFTGWVYGALVE